MDGRTAHISQLSGLRSPDASNMLGNLPVNSGGVPPSLSMSVPNFARQGRKRGGRRRQRRLRSHHVSPPKQGCEQGLRRNQIQNVIRRRHRAWKQRQTRLTSHKAFLENEPQFHWTGIAEGRRAGKKKATVGDPQLPCTGRGPIA